jgi:hypothetical protein
MGNAPFSAVRYRRWVRIHRMRPASTPRREGAVGRAGVVEDRRMRESLSIRHHPALSLVLRRVEIQRA